MYSFIKYPSAIKVILEAYKTSQRKMLLLKKKT